MNIKEIENKQRELAKEQEKLADELNRLKSKSVSREPEEGDVYILEGDNQPAILLKNGEWLYFSKYISPFIIPILPSDSITTNNERAKNGKYLGKFWDVFELKRGI